MAFRSYGGLMWNDQPTEPYNSTGSQATALAVAVGAGAAGMYLATRRMSDGRRPIDYVSAHGRLTGNLSPFQLLNTFRIPEILSPFTSLSYKAGQTGSLSGVTYWERDFLQSDSTRQWLQFVTGKTGTELDAAGLPRGMEAGSGSVADALVWEQRGKSTTGSLYSVFGGAFDKDAGRWVGGTKKLLTHDIALQAMSHEVINPFTQERGLNRIAAGMFSAADMYATETFNEREVFGGPRWSSALDRTVTTQAAFMPVPAIAGSLGSLGDLARRTTMIRGVAAFEMDRFNRLIKGVSEQFLGESGSKAFKSILGVGPGVRSGPASAMMARFGGRAIMAGGAVLAVGQLDWVRRNFSLPGEVLASGAISAGVAYAASKLRPNVNTAMFAGVASFFGQMVLPGFDQGIIQGLSTTAANLDVVRANSLNPFNYLRRTLEGFAPGITNWETGALVGIGAVAASSARLPRAGQSWAQRVLQSQSFGPARLGLDLDPADVDAVGRANASVRDIYWGHVSALDPSRNAAHTTFEQRRSLMKQLKTDKYRGRHLELMQDLNSAFYRAEKDIDAFRGHNPMNEALYNRLVNIRNKYGAAPSALGAVRREAEGFAAQAYHSFFGANLSFDKNLRRQIQDLGFGSLGIPTPTGRLGKWGSVGLAAFGAHQLLTGGLLGSKETAGDLRDIYAGRKSIAVKSSRWWEAGGTPFEGGETEYYRPHQYHLMMNRVRERGIWGEDEDRLSPMGKFFRKNFTYELERRQYWDRPYPMSSAAFSDFPIIGGVLAGTIGKLVKPAKVMHAGEWMRPGEGEGLEYASVYQGSRREPAFALGAHHGIPQDPYGMGAQLSFLSYQFRELEGMTGWAKNVVQQTLTGEDVWGADSPMLADTSLMTSSRLRFWEMQMGGGLFANEFLRRVLPRYRSEIDRVNPVANAMPSWLPDKFKWGDPYRAVEWGESRLPGAGYAALHPELEGMDPEAYPLLFKYAILSDVAPLSAEYQIAKETIYRRRLEGAYNQRQIAFMEQVDAQHREAVSGFADDRLHERAIRLPGSSLTRAAWAGSQRLARGVAAPAEYLVPMGFRPMQKLMGKRDMIEQYEYERLYGTPMAFWDKPWRDWLRPSMYSALNMMGWEGKPMWRHQADDAQAYFDQLEFLKWSNLREQAELTGDKRTARRYRWAQANTRMGVNPQGSPLSIYWTLPDKERKFFNTFAHASGKDRHRIAEMIPEDQVHLYKAMWSRMDAGDPELWGGAPAEISDAYLAQQMDVAHAAMAGRPMPPEDWVGWHEDVDMDDIKVRYVDRIGAELHDYGMWESQLKKSMQQPMLEGSTDYITRRPGALLGSGLGYIAGVPGQRGSWQAAPWGGMMSSTQITYNDQRSADIATAVEGFLSGY